MNRKIQIKVVSLVLLGAGMFQVLAAVILLFFWLVVGDWRPYWPHIIGIAFWLSLPVSYCLWRSYERSR